MKLIRTLNVCFAIFGGYILLLLSFLIVTEIVARKFFSYSLQGIDEIGGYVVAVTGTFGFAYALIERAHTRIDIILDHVSRQIRNILNLLAYVLVTGTALFMLYYGYVALNESILFNSRSSTPLQTIMWIPQGMWFAGLCVFSVTSVAVLVHLVMLQIRNPERGFHLYGPQTVQQEVDREVAQAEARRANAKTPGGTDDGKAS